MIMKRTVIIIVVAAVALIGAGLSFAQMGGGWGPGAGCNCRSGYTGANGTVSVEDLKKFQKETLSMRDELIANRAELANEYAKPAPDETRIADLRKQMIDTRTKIQKVGEKYGLPAQQSYGRGMGRGMMAGSRNGCPLWQ
jgi:zinc resistance-associated protein